MSGNDELQHYMQACARLRDEKTLLGDALVELSHQVEALTLRAPNTFEHEDTDAFSRAAMKAKATIKTVWQNPLPSGEPDLATNALKEVLKLIDEGILVRNTDDDSDFTVYAQQAGRLVQVLQQAQALVSAKV